jgi:DHA3 family macrolide efflux protein-like MFS transporter
VLIGGILVGLVLGLLGGGRITNLASVRLRWVPLLMVAVILRFGTEWLLLRGNTVVESLRLPLFATSFVLLLIALWVNRSQPGMRLAFVGILSNTIAIVANGGHMPIWIRSLEAANFSVTDLTSPFHTPLPAALDVEFFRHAGPLADIIPIPLPIIQNVASIGDVFLTAGLAFFLFATVVRRQGEDVEPEFSASEGPLTGLAGATRLPRGLEAALGLQRIRPGTGLANSLAETAALDRPLVLGGTGTGLAGPSARGLLGRVRGADGQMVDVWGRVTTPAPRAIALAPVGAGRIDDGAIEIPGRPRVDVGARVRRHPYVRLSLNGPFTSLWTGQMISLFGDRIHQIALAFLVGGVTNSIIAVAFVFVAATIPNLLLAPIAGAYVDRWNHRDVMIVSDLLRAAVVLLMPIAIFTNVYLVYPMIFLITSISIFFRPARVAILPRIVHGDDLLTANSALWAGETFADVIGYPLAGLFVAFLGPALPLAFWIDAATYGASAILIASIAVPKVQRARRRVDPAIAGPITAPSLPGATSPEAIEDARAAAADDGSPRSVIAEMREGFHFLRREPVLFANTIQAAFAQFAIGSLTALTPIFVRDVIGPANSVDPAAAYSFLEASIGVGNLVGGFVIGLVGMHFAKGRMVIAGYVLFGLFLIGFALSGSLTLDFGLLLGAGIANMIFVIPSQVLFQQRTPSDLIGRVVSFRFALVFGSMTLAMAIGGVLGQVVGIAPVLAISGLASIVAGLAGLFVPAMRDA